MTAPEKILQGLRVFGSDVAQGFFDITHNGMALVGVAVVFAALTIGLRPDLQDVGEAHLGEWLQARKAEAMGLVADLSGTSRATASDPGNLPQQQAAVAHWLSRKYRVAPEPLSALVAEAYEIGPRAKVEPTLILAVMAIESGFNPFAQSPVGAQGLMQVMTKVHGDKYALFGGKLAAFDPVSNLRVGVRVLQECIARAGSLEAGLRYYVGAANLPDDGGYAEKVLAEHERLRQVAAGRNISPFPAPALRATTPARPSVEAPDEARLASAS